MPLMKSTIAGFIPRCTNGTRVPRPTTWNASLSTIRYSMLVLPSTTSLNVRICCDCNAFFAVRASCGPTPCMALNALAKASFDP